MTKGIYCELYAKYVICRFAPSCVVAFDGYENSADTKDHEHQRRMGKVLQFAPDVAMVLTNPLVFDKETFLAKANKK